MSPASLPYRDFYYPLNVFMHILTHEEGSVSYLHYGLFESERDTIGQAQERSTALLLSRLPPPPASLLEVGTGLGTTLRLLTGLGYDAEGITPDERQIAVVRERHGSAVRVHQAAFETFESGRTYDAIVFQESSQYIESDALFARAAAIAPLVVVLDEFALQPLEGLHRLDRFLDAAAGHGFELVEELDLSGQATPSTKYFLDRFPRYRSRLEADLGLTAAQYDELVASGEKYLQRYRDGEYGYRLLRLVKGSPELRPSP